MHSGGGGGAPASAARCSAAIISGGRLGGRFGGSGRARGTGPESSSGCTQSACAARPLKGSGPATPDAAPFEAPASAPGAPLRDGRGWVTLKETVCVSPGLSVTVALKVVASG